MDDMIGTIFENLGLDEVQESNENLGLDEVHETNKNVGLEEVHNVIVPSNFCATRHFPEDATKVLYHELFYRNKDFVGAVGSSTYGEINKSGVWSSQTYWLHSPAFLQVGVSPEEKSNFQMIDVEAGLMTTLAHIAQEIEGQYCGLEICPTRARLSTLSYERFLKTNVLHNTKIAYVWDDVKNVTKFDFDLVYAFDETMDPYCLDPHDGGFQEFSKVQVPNLLQDPKGCFWQSG